MTRMKKKQKIAIHNLSIENKLENLLSDISNKISKIIGNNVAIYWNLRAYVIKDIYRSGVPLYNILNEMKKMPFT